MNSKKKTLFIVIIALITTLGVLFVVPNLGNVYRVSEVSVEMNREVPLEIKDAIENLQVGVLGLGMNEAQTLVIQQDDGIKLISKALQDRRVTSKGLSKYGCECLGPYRSKVNVRYAIICWRQLEALSQKSRNKRLSKDDIDTSEKLAKVVGSQIGSIYAKNEGLNVSHGELYRVMYPIRNKGRLPDF